MFAAPAVAVVGAAVLRTRRPLIYWFFCCLLTSMIAAPFYYFARTNIGPPFNAPSVVVVVFVVAPTLATFAIERLWFVLGRAVERPWATAALSLLGLLVYVLTLIVAVVVAVNLGVLSP
jgi:hypothetical protein